MPKADGRTVTTDVAVVAAGRFTPRPKAELVVRIDEVKKISAKPAGGAEGENDSESEGE